MSMNRRFPTLLIAALMVSATTFAILGQAQIVNDDHLETIRDAHGADAPHGQWARIMETHHFYLHSEEAPEPGELGVQDGTIDYAPPEEQIGKTFTVTSQPGVGDVEDTEMPAEFDLPVDLNTSEDLKIYEIYGEVYGTCTTDNVAVEVFRLRLDEDGNWIEADADPDTESTIDPLAEFTLALEQGASQRFSGDVELGDSISADNGAEVKAGERLRFKLAPDLAGFGLVGGSCTLHYDGWGSNEAGGQAEQAGTDALSMFTIKADSARVNLWTENLDGAPVDGFPGAATAPPQDRQFNAQMIHVSAWRSVDHYQGARSEPVDYQQTLWEVRVSNGQFSLVEGDDRFETRILDQDDEEVEFAASPAHQSGQPFTILLDPPAEAIETPGENIQHRTRLISYSDALEDGEYRYQIFGVDGGVATTWEISIGLKGIALTLADNEQATHLVNPEEPTRFRFKITNTGSQQDIISLQASDPGQNWIADLDQGTYIVGGGDSTIATLTVIPPSSATDGDAQDVQVTASSTNFPNEVDAVRLPVTVEVTDAVDPGFAVELGRESLDVTPGQTISGIAFSVRNTGHSEDIALVTTSVPTFVEGWGIEVSTQSATIPAGSTKDYTLTVRAPPNAEPGDDDFDLTVEAERLGDADIFGTADMAINVIQTFGVEIGKGALKTEGLTLFNTERHELEIPFSLLESGALKRSDGTHLFRVPITNLGSQQDTFTITSNDLPVADGNNGGVCDKRVAFGDPEDLTTSAADDFKVETEVEVPARTTVYKYMMLGWDVRENGTGSNDECANFGGNVILDLTARSQLSLGESDGQRYRVDIDRGTPADDRIRAVDATFDPVMQDGHATVREGGTGVQRIHAINAGNHFDELIVSIPDLQRNGWERELQFVGSIGNYTDDSDVIDCSPEGDNTTWVCSNMGIYDEAVFELLTTPGPNVRIGSSGATLDTTVTVQIAADGTKVQRLEASTRLVGDFEFQAQPLRSQEVEAEQGKSIALPFAVENLGTAADRFNFEITAGDATWSPRVSMGESSFIPAESTLVGFLSLTIPEDAPTGEGTLFRLQVTMDEGEDFDIVDFLVIPVEPSPLDVEGVPSNEVVMNSGSPTQITVKAIDTTGNDGATVTFEADRNSLPAGWGLDATEATKEAVLSEQEGEVSAQVTFNVTVPEGELGTSRGVLHVDATTDTSPALTSSTDIALQIRNTFAVQLEDLTDQNDTVIVPNGNVVHRVRIENQGLGEDVFTFSHSDLPAGWTVAHEFDQLTLGPLESVVREVQVTAPGDAVPEARATTVLTGRSQGDTTLADSVELVTTVGFYDLEMTTESLPTVFGAPEETVTQSVTLFNNGTLPDEIIGEAVLETAGLGPHVDLQVTPEVGALDPGQSVDARLSWTFSDSIPSDIDLESSVTFTSTLDNRDPPASFTRALAARVLPYVAQDADDDGIGEYAVDRNRDNADGFEEFKESTTVGGRQSRVIDIESFLEEDARERFLVQVTDDEGNTTTRFRFFIDGDEDGRMDFLLDDSGNGLPNVYWDPDRGHSHRITVFKDVNADNVPDYFVDLNGDGLWNAVYDLTEGDFTPVLHRDVDGDGQQDYIVDANENGQVDDDETVLFVRSGDIVTVQKVDVDGDGCLDDVFDVDGDGTPDHFIPCGATASIDLVLRDVNGDGVLDWTFDADGDGRRESYYDPAAEESSLIDTTSNFLDTLIKYWYVGALFALVLVLFVVLIAVTRR